VQSVMEELRRASENEAKLKLEKVKLERPVRNVISGCKKGFKWRSFPMGGDGAMARIHHGIVRQVHQFSNEGNP